MAEDITRKAIQHAKGDLEGVDAIAASEPNRGWWERAKDWFIDKFVPEVWEMVEHKTAQGAAELGQALNSQANAYVPYGAGQAPLEVEGPTTSFQDQLRQASERMTPDRSNEMER